MKNYSVITVVAVSLIAFLLVIVYKSEAIVEKMPLLRWPNTGSFCIVGKCQTNANSDSNGTVYHDDKHKVLSRYQRCVSAKADVCIYKRIKVFCWIFTTADFLKPRSHFVENTWARHCDGHAYFVMQSGNKKAQLDASRLAGLNVIEFTDANEQRPHLYKKTVRALDWMAENKIFDKFDWFMKADDDTFVILENLKQLIADLQADKPYYIGRLLRSGDSTRGFMSGGAGFAMSHAAITMLQQRYRKECPDVPMPCDCDDLIIGQCFDKWKVPIFSSVDAAGKQRFFPLQPEAHFAEQHDEKSSWIANNIPPVEFGLNCCSNSTISFHYVRGSSQSMFYNFVYRFPPRRLRNTNEHSSALIADCLRYAIDESLELDDVNATDRNASISKPAPNLAEFLSGSDIIVQKKSDLFSAIDSSLLFKMLTFDESFCESL